MKRPRIILASKSPRRKFLLEEAGYEVIIYEIDIEESYPASLASSEVAEYLARKKSEAFNGDLENDEVLLTADSIVVLNDKVYGKPANREEAFQTIKELSDKIHYVYTGVCLKTRAKTVSFTEKAEIKFSYINDEEINFYIDQYKPFDKAGSYGIQEWIGLCKIEWIRGTMSNVMGLPMASVYREINKLVN